MSLSRLSPLQPAIVGYKLSNNPLTFLRSIVFDPMFSALVTTPTIFFKILAPVTSTVNRDPVFAGGSFVSAVEPQTLAHPPKPRTQTLKAHFEHTNDGKPVATKSEAVPGPIFSITVRTLNSFCPLCSKDSKGFHVCPFLLITKHLRHHSQAQPSQVVKTPQQPPQPVQPAAQDPMNTSIPQVMSAIKKGLNGIKGSASITPSTIKAIVSLPLRQAKARKGRLWPS